MAQPGVEMSITDIQRVVQRPLNHVSWLVEDIDAAARFWAATLGVGPFLLIEDAVLDEVSHKGKPCVFDHCAAFSKWGDLSIELQQISDARPYAVASGWGVGTGYHVNHVSYTVPDPDEESERLEALGMPCFLTWKDGPLHANCHQSPFFGPSVEVHTEGTLDGFWEAIGEATKDWDGTEPLRKFDLPFK